MPASKRRWGREMALRMLYQAELGGSSAVQVIAAFDPFEGFAPEPGQPPRSPERLREAFAFASDLVTGALERLDEIDERLSGQATNWRLERMPAVDRNILRLAVYELLASTDVPPLVVLDEAIELAKQYGSEQSGSFVNGLLDGILRRLETGADSVASQPSGSSAKETPTS